MNELEIIGDVIVRFVAHSQYGTIEKAQKALAKRLGGIEKEEAEKILKKHIKIYELAKQKILKTSYVGDNLPENIFKKIQKEISEETRCTEEESSRYIGWCYFWYVLK